ncbi:MAG: PAS domain S-box protein [Pyrinomonadaceae bacterium]
MKFTYLVGLTNAELQKTLAELPPHTIVSYLTSVQDRFGNTHDNVDVLRQISPETSAPIYGTTDAQLGNGIVGGMILSYETLGVEAARVSLRVLAGENPDAISPHAVPSIPMFDGRQLRRWGIRKASLPADTVIRYTEPTVWEEYGWYIIGLLTALAVETLLIVWMIFLHTRRRQAEAENLLLNSRLAEIVSNVPGIVWESRTDPQTNVRRTTFISDYVQKFLGYTAQEWLAKPRGFGLDIVTDADRERTKRESEAVIETGIDGVSEFRWRTKDGGIRWVENHLSPIFDGDAKVIGLRGVALDVTNRKLAEDKARQTEERDRAILAAIPDLMIVQTPDGVYLDFHANDPDDLLLPPESFLGKNMREVLPPELAEKFAEAFERAEPMRKPQLVEYQMKLGGLDRWFEARIVRSNENILAMVHDITERKRALDELRRSEERFSKAFRSNPQPMTLTTVADGRYVDFNESFLAMCGYTHEEVIGRTSVELGTWDDSGSRANLIKELKEHGSVLNMETICRTKDGGRRDLLISAETLEIGGEQCLLLAASDITERMMAQQGQPKLTKS